MGRHRRGLNRHWLAVALASAAGATVWVAAYWWALKPYL